MLLPRAAVVEVLLLLLLLHCRRRSGRERGALVGRLSVLLVPISWNPKGTRPTLGPPLLIIA